MLAQEVLQQIVSGFGEDRFRMELHTLDGKLAMAHAHDLAVVGGRGHDEVRRERVAGDGERRRLGEFAAAAIGEPVDRNDDRLWESLDAGGDALPARDELLAGRLRAGGNAPGEFMDVGARRECAIA